MITIDYIKKHSQPHDVSGGRRINLYNDKYILSIVGGAQGLYGDFEEDFEIAIIDPTTKDFSDSDFLLAMGDPVAIAIASIVASDINNGRLKILKWDREHRAYYPVEIDIYNNRKENEDYVG